MEKFIVDDVWNEVNDLISSCNKQKLVSISYVTSSNLRLAKGDVLICDVSDYSIMHGETSIKVLQTYLSRGVEIYSLEQLHSKFLVSEDFLVIGSANLSENSADNLIESAVVTDSDILIKEAISFFMKLKSVSQSLTIEKVEELLYIPVKRLDERQRNLCKRRELFPCPINNVNVDAPEKYLLKVSDVSVRSKDNEEYIYLKACAANNILSKEQTKHIYDKEKIDEWKEVLSKNTAYPKIYGTYKLVLVPKYVLKRDRNQIHMTEIDVLVFCDKDGNLQEDPYEVAMGKLGSKYYTLL